MWDFIKQFPTVYKCILGAMLVNGLISIASLWCSPEPVVEAGAEVLTEVVKEQGVFTIIDSY